jgi:hypothetical protein
MIGSPRKLLGIPRALGKTDSINIKILFLNGPLRPAFVKIPFQNFAF